MELDIPAIEGIGGSLPLSGRPLRRNGTIYDVDFEPVAEPRPRRDQRGPHLPRPPHAQRAPRADGHWADFYERLFNFREIRYFDIEGKETGLFSQAMTSPCGKIRIPLNESQDDKSRSRNSCANISGEGIQHIALGTDDIYRTVDVLRARGIAFQDTPDTYYERVDARVQGHGENARRAARSAAS